MMETMAKKVDIEKESMIKMLTPETFNLDVKQLSAKMPVMDAILFYCEQNQRWSRTDGRSTYASRSTCIIVK